MHRSKAQDVSPAQKVAFLKHPESYQERPPRVEIVETHMAWVFLAGRYAYKLKKPVRYNYLDFSTVEARRRDAEEEVRLNRRLAEDVYLAAVPLVLDAQGRMQLEGEGAVLDWLVKMRRLPADRMLDRALKRWTLTEAEVQRVAQKLAAFYRSAAVVPLSPEDYRGRFEQDVCASAQMLSTSSYKVARQLVEEALSAQRAFLEDQVLLLEARAGKVVEAHGDLRPDHVCLEEPEPVIFDCLAFNRDLRLLDPADELAFLAMECERLGAPFVGRIAFETYEDVMGDRLSEELIRFYKSYRAGLRARLSIRHLSDADVRAPATRWRAQSEAYLRQAISYLE